MAFRKIGNSVIIAAVAAFSGAGAKQTPQGASIRVSNRSNSVCWVVLEDTQAAANAAAISTPGAPAGSFALDPGATELFANPLAMSNQGAWVNACTPTDVTGTSFVEFEAGSGE